MRQRLVVTGAEGFLGWHIRVLAHAWGLPAPVLVTRRDELRLADAISGTDRVVHLAGVNRGAAEQVHAGNLDAALVLARALRACATPPKTVVFANSVQAGNGTAYGDSKAAAAATLADATEWIGSSFMDVRLPNVFGEHGRPHYNSVVATFCRVLADGGVPDVRDDRELDLLHATDAAAQLLGLELSSPVGTHRISVAQLAERLIHVAAVYRGGEIPELATDFDVRLFNTYRSHRAPARFAMPRHGDDRGELVEAVRQRRGAGQAFYSATRPGRTRGEHYHLAKVERFMVVSGEAEIALRRLLHDEVLRIRVTGAQPMAVDMPTMWAHSITNVGASDLVTLFWSNELFDPDRPDTYAEQVARP